MKVAFPKLAPNRVLGSINPDMYRPAPSNGPLPAKPHFQLASGRPQEMAPIRPSAAARLLCRLAVQLGWRALRSHR
jgi:hypothetical protein